MGGRAPTVGPDGQRGSLVRIAIIGAGISGLTAAHYLASRHRVVLFEAEKRLGGHTHTVDVMEGGCPIPVDTGFIVFNTRTYPNFVRLLADLGVGWTESDMSFSARSERRDFEYSAPRLSGLFAQRRRLLSPGFARMVVDIGRFYREARTLLEDGAEVPLLEWLRERRYSTAFIDDHLFPLVRAVWSANREVAERFPARFLARFFDNHGFLQLFGAPRWLTISGGARSYVRAILSRFPGEVRLGVAVRSVRRAQDGVVVSSEWAGAERFDHLIIACHSDQALALLTDASQLERSVLGAIPYQRSEAVLHTDQSVMPRNRPAWSSWNVHLDDEGADGPCLTYWMNRLQPLGAARNYFVTLNRSERIHPEHVIHRQVYAHPVFTAAGVQAQARYAELIAHRHTSYAGAWLRNGFHEDGVVSALRVVERLLEPEKLSPGLAA